MSEANLAAMLAATDARFDPEVLEILNDTRKFCPKCERLMVLRTSRKCRDAGSQFWGCSAYPRCQVTLTQLQRGRAQLSAELDGKPLALPQGWSLQRGRAQLSAEFSTPLLTRLFSKMLQRGRAQLSAEFWPQVSAHPGK